MNKPIDIGYNKQAREEACEKALNKYLLFKDEVKRHDYIVAINMREPSFHKRLHVIDLSSNEVIRNHHVAHGVNSSDINNRAYAIHFSNRSGSHETSLGAVGTLEVYNGAHGRSLRLQGLEKDINDNIYKRSIVIHAANYVTDKYITTIGRAGQSHGCYAVDPVIANSLIDLIKGGVFIYVYY